MVIDAKITDVQVGCGHGKVKDIGVIIKDSFVYHTSAAKDKNII